MEEAAMLWTGGKDSAMALYEATRDGFHVRCLVTFAPPGGAFLAHPLGVMRMQADAMGLPHCVLPVTAPFEESYEAGLRRLRDEMGIGCVITGDIAEVAGHPNWIRQRSGPVGVKVHMPLWHRDRSALMRQLIERGFVVRISCVKTRWLAEAWVGRVLGESAMAELETISEKTGMDVCGEDGDYHTLVTDGPGFERGIEIEGFAVRAGDGMAYMVVGEVGVLWDVDLAEQGNKHLDR